MDTSSLQITLMPAPDERPPENLSKLRRVFEALPIRREDSTDILDVTTSALLASLGTPLGTALGAWLHARYGRKVRLKIGDIEAEAQTLKEVEKLIARAQEIQQRNQPKVVHEP